MSPVSENASLNLGTGKVVTPQKHAAEVTPNLYTPQTFKSPLSFSTITVEQLGITPESFVKNSSGKSSSYLKKSRRRSAVGARGSPETNHLIRFMAQQRALKSAEKSPLARGSPFQGRPGVYQNVNSLREQISAFQSAFHSIKENEKMAPCPETEVEEGPEMAGLAKKEGQGRCWQPGFPGELSSKRRKMSSESSSEDRLSHAGGLGSQTPRADVDRARAAGTSAAFAEQVFLVQNKCIWMSSASRSSVHLEGLEVADWMEGTGSSDAVPLDTLTTGVSLATVPEGGSPATPVCRREVPPAETFVLRSVLKKPCVKLPLESLQEHQNNLCDDGMHPSLASDLLNCCKEQKAEDQENCKVPAFLHMRKRKRVTFGEELSPEVFDESLPANTPLRKGETPARQKDLSRISPPLPELSPVPECLPQPDFDDKGENLENIEPLQISFAVLSPIKSSISETLPGTDTFSSSNNHKEISSCKVVKPTRTSNRRNQLASFTEENVCNLYNAEAQPYKEKKINRRKSQETKCTNRAVPKKKQVFKGDRKKKRKGKKSVEKSLYGEREIASKKPLLSPIPELPEVSEVQPSVAGLQRSRADDFSLTGKLGEVELLKTPAKRKNLFLWNPDLHLQQGLNRADASELCCSDVMGSSLPMAASCEDSDTNTDTDDNADIPQAAHEWQYESELKTEMETESSHVSCVSVTKEHHVSYNPRPDLTPWCQEVAVARQNAEKLCHIFKTAENINLKLEEQDDFLVTKEGQLQCNSTYGSQKEFNCLEDVTRKRKESESHSEDVESQPAESGRVTGRRERKHRRRSLCHSDDHSVWSQQNRNRSPSCGVGSSAEVSLKNSELYKDLSDAIEQAFQRTSSETKVRRSTRLQKDSEDQGLVWLSLPFPSTSQKAKRRMSCILESREFESSPPRKETVWSRQNPGAGSSISGEESSEGRATASSRLPGKRRKSVCASALPSACSSSGPALARRALPKEEAKSLQGWGPGRQVFFVFAITRTSSAHELGHATRSGGEKKATLVKHLESITVVMRTVWLYEQRQAHKKQIEFRLSWERVLRESC
ncbi:cell division cycle-associated protein 2 [Erethizon dorsatum]